MINIYKLFILVLLLTITDCSNNEKEYNTSPKVIKIEFIYENLRTLTFSRVSCNNFENIFEKVLKKKTITNSEEIKKILINIQNVLTDSKIVDNIDVRFKMKLFYKNGTEKLICGSGSTIKLDNKNYLISKKFYLLLTKITDQE